MLTKLVKKNGKDVRSLSLNELMTKEKGHDILAKSGLGDIGTSKVPEKECS
jgi:hypothetical protein